MYKRRVLIFLGLVAACLTVLAGRLFYLQVVRGDAYRRQFEESLEYVELLPAARGTVYDRTGTRPLAVDEPCFDFCLHYGLLSEDTAWARSQQRRIAHDEDVSLEAAAELVRRRTDRAWQTARELATAHGVDLDAAVARVRRRVRAIRRIVGQPVREEQQYHAVVPGLERRELLEDVLGAAYQKSRRRAYPQGDLAGHVVGYVGEVNADEQRRRNLSADEAPWLQCRLHNYLDGDLLGKCGVEKMCETILRGRRGYRRLKRTGGEPELLDEAPAEHGRDVRLTLDLDLQRRCRSLLREAGGPGAFVVVSVPTGEVLALVSVPGYDPGRFRRDRDYARGVLTDERDLPLLNRAAGRRLPTGSTIKPIVALGALACEAITPQTTFFCRGYLHTPGSFRCHSRHGHIALHEAIQRSCNVYFYNVGERMGPRRLADWLQRWGFDEPPGTGLPRETAGIVPTAAWLARHRRRHVRPGDARNMAVGQGEFCATPLHMAAAVAAIARDGSFLSPVLVRDGGPPQTRRTLPVSPAHLRVVQSAMDDVVNRPGGTAYRAFHRMRPYPGVRACGKTGTAQTAPQRVDSNNNGRIDAGDRVVRSGDTAWFVGYAPRDRPQIAFAIVRDYAGHGGTACAPLAADFLRYCTERGMFR